MKILCTLWPYESQYLWSPVHYMQDQMRLLKLEASIILLQNSSMILMTPLRSYIMCSPKLFLIRKEHVITKHL